MPFWGDVQTANMLLQALSVLVLFLAFAIFRYRFLYRQARDENENHHDLIENLTEGIYRSTPEGKQLSANRALVRLNGFENETEMLDTVTNIAREWYVDPKRRDVFRAILRRDGKIENFVSEVYRYKTRERIWISESARLVHDHKTGVPLFYEGSVKEITETFTRLNLEEMFQKLTSQVPGGLFQILRRTDGTYSVPYVSSGFLRIAHVQAGDEFPVPAEFLKRIHSDHRKRFSESLSRSAREMLPWDCEFRSAVATGKQQKWLRVTAKPEAVADGIKWHGYLVDISIRKKHEMEIERLAFHDPLTDVANRRMFMNHMSETLRICAATGRRGVLLFIDLDNFKILNDTMGHAVGDALLKQAARRLVRCVGRTGLVARIGGDEFVIVMSNGGRADTEAEANRRAIILADKVLSAMRRPFNASVQASASASVGVVVFDGSQGIDEILKQADTAMYQAKSDGRNGLALFEAARLMREMSQDQQSADTDFPRPDALRA